MRAGETILLALVACVLHKTFGHDRGNVAMSPVNGMKLLSRSSRTLLYPNPSTLLLIFGIGTPLQLDSESVIVGAFTKMVYTLPQNSTDFTESGVQFARNGQTRWTIYKILESTANSYGFEGKPCLLQAICELAAVPFDLRHGIFGQIIQTLLTPSSTIEPYDEYQDREYHAAESLGKHVGENCHALYPECHTSALDVFSTIG
ncbi:uncharacterized protein [Fopius arisanus]|uniref:MetE_0 protein n=1 Tax=Fopius arisanus TaxID=64838 RepID=A0A0C9R517_9HYME|nr:PREDICTED: uncharacterized protein LOC105267126 [Fopius arisanus]